MHTHVAIVVVCTLHHECGSNLNLSLYIAIYSYMFCCQEQKCLFKMYEMHGGTQKAGKKIYVKMSCSYVAIGIPNSI